MLLKPAFSFLFFFLFLKNFLLLCSGCESASTHPSGSLGKRSSNYGSSPVDSLGGNPMMSCYDYGYSDKNSNCSGGGGGNGNLKDVGGRFVASTPAGTNLIPELRPLSEHFYEQPMVVFPNNNNNSRSDNNRRSSPVFASASDERTPFVDRGSTGGSSGGMPSPVVASGGGGGSKQTARSIPPSHLGIPRGAAEGGSFAWATLGEAGGKISAPGGVSLTVPQGAICAPVRRDLYVSGLPSSPALDSGRVAVTPVAQCGPANLTHTLQKPVVLSLPHMGVAAAHQRRALTALYCADAEAEDAEWEAVDTAGNGSGSSNVSGSEGGIYLMELDSTTVHLVTERLGAYVLIANVAELNGAVPSSSSSVQQPRSVGNSSSSGCSSLPPSSSSQQNSPDHSQKLSPSTKAALSRILDVPSCEGNGWQQLAESLGADHYSAFFATQPSPSEALLNLWEARARDDEPLRTLARMLKEIRREDAIVILERDLGR